MSTDTEPTRPYRYFTYGRLWPWRRWTVKMFTPMDVPDMPGWTVDRTEVVARYWSERKAAGLVRVLNIMQRNGGEL